MSTLTDHDKEQTRLFDKAAKPRKPSGILETRCLKFCQRLIRDGGGQFVVEWTSSRNPVLKDWDGYKCSNIGGGGYDKLSACLNQVLGWMFPEPVNLGSGQGWQRVQSNLKERGWDLQRTAYTASADVFTLERVKAAEPDPAPVPIIEDFPAMEKIRQQRGLPEMPPPSLPPDPDGENDKRAGFAAGAVAHFAALVRQRDEETATTVQDLLCDIRHFCDRQGIDFAEVLESSAYHYEIETTPGHPHA